MIMIYSAILPSDSATSEYKGMLQIYLVLPLRVFLRTFGCMDQHMDHLEITEQGSGEYTVENYPALGGINDINDITGFFLIPV